MNIVAPASRPLVSVIIPTYNRARLLQTAVGSVLGQEGQGEVFDLEVLVADDASSDSTPDVCRRFGVRHVRNEVNRGAAAARNRALQDAGGPYVAFLDDDDVWFPSKLRIQVSILEREPEAGAVYSQVIELREGKVSVWPREDPWLSRGSPNRRIFLPLLMGNFVPVQTVLARRDAFAKAGFFDETLIHRDDYDMWIRLAFHYPILFVPSPLALHQPSGEGPLQRFKDQEGWDRNLFTVLEKALSLLEDSTGDSSSFRGEVLTRARLNLANECRQFGEYDRAHAYIARALEESPWLVEDSTGRSQIKSVMTGIALESPSPRSLLDDIHTRARSASGTRPIKVRLSTRRWLAHISMAVAGILVRRSPPMGRSALAFVFRAISDNPLSILQAKRGMKLLLKLLRGAPPRLARSGPRTNGTSRGRSFSVKLAPCLIEDRNASNKDLG